MGITKNAISWWRRRALRRSHVLGAGQTADELSGRSRLGSLRRPDQWIKSPAAEHRRRAALTLLRSRISDYVPGFR